MDTNRYETARKRAPGKNPVVLGSLATAWIFWLGVALAALLFVGAMIWLLNQPSATNTEPSARPAVAFSPLPGVHTRE